MRVQQQQTVYLHSDGATRLADPATISVTCEHDKRVHSVGRAPAYTGALGCAFLRCQRAHLQSSQEGGGSIRGFHNKKLLSRNVRRIDFITSSPYQFEKSVGPLDETPLDDHTPFHVPYPFAAHILSPNNSTNILPTGLQTGSYTYDKHAHTVTTREREGGNNRVQDRVFIRRDKAAYIIAEGM